MGHESSSSLHVPTFLPQSRILAPDNSNILYGS